jgi:hypothetical protein
VGAEGIGSGEISEGELKSRMGTIVEILSREKQWDTSGGCGFPPEKNLGNSKKS